jgi:benzoate membrane transport protein
VTGVRRAAGGAADADAVAAGPGPGAAAPYVAGVSSALVGFTSSFAVVLGGLQASGATPRQAASGLMALCVAMGLLGVYESLRTRMPVSIAWSTPGAALLATAGVVEGGFAGAVGAFLACGLLLALAGLWRPLGRLVARIPPPLASAMLAGVLLRFCLAPVEAVAQIPAVAVPVVLAWAVVSRFSRAWSVPAAVVVATVAVALTERPGLPPLRALWPDPVVTAPTLSVSAVVSVAVPLFIVTMASQNVPGLAVLSTYGYRPAAGPLFLSTGLGTVLVAPLGGHAVNLAAISAAIVAGDDASADPARRWVAGVTNGVAYVVLGVAAGAVTLLVASAPPLLVLAVGGLGVLGAFVASVSAAVADPAHREAAVVTFLVAASGVTVLGVGAACWALAVGGGFLLVRRRTAAPARP